MKKRKKGYWFLFGLTILVTLAAISTLIPVAFASKECMLGYKAHCTFTPMSTVILIVGGGVICVIRKRRFTEEV